MRDFEVRGAVVAVVRGGRVVLAKGYGYEDEAGTPVTPDRTVFRVGSVSKIVTAMAASSKWSAAGSNSTAVSTTT